MSQLGGGLLEPHLLLGFEKAVWQTSVVCLQGGRYACSWAGWSTGCSTQCLPPHHTGSMHVPSSSRACYLRAQEGATTLRWQCFTQLACLLLAVRRRSRTP
jgi:hypothetical protein